MRKLKHPFGFLDGERVVPAEVEDGETVECPLNECSERLHVRGPSANGTVRHFWHPGSGGGGVGGSHGGGGVGESATHKNYKSHAASALLNFFDGFIEESTAKEIFEQRVSIPDTDRYRQADTRVTLESPHSTFGKGIIIEVQHENRGKDIGSVTEDYLDAGYSVYWTDSEAHYEPGGYLFGRDQFESEAVTVWPNAVPEMGEWDRPRYELRYISNRSRRWECRYTTDGSGDIKPGSRQWNPSFPYMFAEMEFGVEFNRPYYSTTVQLPRGFYEDRVREAFRETPWHELFPGYEWETRTSFPEPDGGAKRNEHVDAVLLHEWAGPPEKQVFRDTPWEDLFPGYEWAVEDISAGCSVANNTAEAKLPERWILPLIRDEFLSSLDGHDIPHPGHPWHVAERCLKKVCLPGKHEWIELTGSQSAEWRECRRCGLNDVTWEAVYGEGVAETAGREPAE